MSISRSEIRRKQREQKKKGKLQFISQDEIRRTMYAQLDKDLDIHWEINYTDWLYSELWNLRVNYKWGKKRLINHVNKRIFEAKCVRSGHLSIDDIKKELNDIGVVINLDEV